MLYRENPQLNLDGEPDGPQRHATLEEVGEYYNECLKNVFAYVYPKQRRLNNSRGNPLYLLCLACGNPRATHIVEKIAPYIMEEKGGDRV